MSEAQYIASQITLADLEGGNLYPLLHRLREQEPVAWLPAINAWLVTNWETAVTVMRDSQTFTVDHPGFSTAQVVGSSMLSLDGQAHQQHRKPFERPFHKQAVATRFSDGVSQHIDGLLTTLLPRQTAELRRDYAGPVAVQTMIIALGLNQVPVATLLNWYDEIVAAVTNISAGQPVGKAGQDAFAALRDGLLPSLRRDPESSLLAAASQGASHLTDDEIVANAAVLLFGGIETTEGMIANALYHLLTAPAILQAVREDLLLVTAVVEESLRLEPAASVVDRYAVRDVELAGAHIKAGDLVRVSLVGANRDPAVFPQPDQFDPTRPNLQSHVAFAQGPHVCLGLHLARLEAQQAVAQAIQRLPNLRLRSGKAVQEAAKPHGLIFRKPQAINVVWDL